MSLASCGKAQPGRRLRLSERSTEDSKQSEEAIPDLEIQEGEADEVRGGHTDDDDLDQLVIQR